MQNNDRLFLFAHAGSKNHGCEAIVRSTAALFPDKEVILASLQPSEDDAYGLSSICSASDTKKQRFVRLTAKWWKAYLQLKSCHDSRPLDDIAYTSKLRTVRKTDVAFSIGGDNYSYSTAGARRYMDYHKRIRRSGAKTVLWGCSIDPVLIDGKMRKDLARYDLITARETITYEALQKINPNTILAPDPAFTLRSKPGIYPQGLGKRPYIGINISPLIQSNEKHSGITMTNYLALMSYLIEHTDRDIALIPHVVWYGNDDRIPLEQLYARFKDSGRVHIVEDQNCMQLKDIISGCEFFVGARTHATIAAYSSCVPTLVVGYSVKAKGIARDLFGTEDDYVLPVQQLEADRDLVDAFRKLYARRSHIYDHLSKMMPGYIQGIEIARKAVDQL